MKKLLSRAMLTVTFLLLGAIAATPAIALTVSVSGSAPTVDGQDISVLNQTGKFEDWGNSSIWNDKPARGQTFTTPGVYTILSSYTVQSDHTQADDGTYYLRVGTLSGTNFTSFLAEESVYLTDNITSGDYVTFTLADPIMLEPNTLYGVDIGTIGNGWDIANNADTNYTGGSAYSSGTSIGIGTNNIIAHSFDRIFHLDLAPATVLHWDINGATAGAGGATPAGTWDGATANWTTNSAGTIATETWPAGGTAIFAAGSDASGSYTVTASGTRDISGLRFEEGAVTISGGTSLRLVTNATVYVESGLTATIATNLTEDATARDLTKTGDGTLTFSGTNSYTGETIINAGTLDVYSHIAGLSGSSLITFTGDSTLRVPTFGGPYSFTNMVVDTGVTATFDVGGGGAGVAYTINSLSGDGTFSVPQGNAGAGKTITFGSLSSFTGTLEYTGSERVRFYFPSLADSAAKLRTAGTDTGRQPEFIYTGDSPLVLTNRQLEMASTGSIALRNDNASAANTFSILTDLLISAAGNKNLYLYGTNTGTNLFAGAITNGASATITVRNGSGSAWSLSGTNTYSGNTRIESGTLKIRGKDAMSPNSTIYMQRWTGLQLLMDDAGTVNLGNEIDMNAIDTSSGVTTVYTITVGNNGGATTGSTIALGTIDFNGGGGNASSARILWANGANDYRLGVGDCIIGKDTAHTGQNQAQGFMAMSAAISITGTVKQVDGNTGNTTANYLYLGGTNTGNEVTGLIKDPDDYPGNANAQPLKVRINGATHYATENSYWTFSNTNTYSGGTWINNGKLFANATNALGFGDVTVNSTAGDLIMVSDDAMHSNATLYLPDSSTETLIMTGNCSVAKLYLGVVPQANGDYTSSSGTWISGPGTLTVGGPLMYWDIDGATTGSGPDDTPDGTWDVGTTANWDNNSTGTGAAVTWSQGLTPNFSAGTDASGDYTVTVSGTPDISGLVFEEGNVTVSGGTALRLTADSVVKVTSGSQTATVSTVISEDGTPRDLLKSGDGTLNLSGANTYSGSTIIGAGTVRAIAADAVRGTNGISIANGATLVATVDGAIDGGEISIANGATFEMTHSNAIADAGGLIIEHTGSIWPRDIDMTISNLTIQKGSAATPDGYVIAGSNLNFVSGGTIDSTYTSAETVKFTCNITGSPDVTISRMDQNKWTWFAPGPGTNQALGAITHPYPGSGTSDKGSLYLDGESTNNTIESIGWVTYHYGYMYKNGTGKWTVNGDVEQGLLQVNAGTLIINGTFESRYQGLNNVSGKLGGNLNIGTASYRASSGSRTVNSGGILAPGDGGAGTMAFEWLGSGGMRSFTFADSSIYEWDIGSTTNDRIDMQADNNFTLDLNNFVLKIQDDGGKPVAGTELTVFTYDSANVTIDTNGFGNTTANFDTNSLDDTWVVTTLSLTDDGAGRIYLTGINKKPGGSVFMFK